MKKVFQIILFSLAINLSAQSYNQEYVTKCILANSESLFVHLNSQIFTTGEELFYKVHLQSNEQYNFRKTSSIVYFEIRNYNQQLVYSGRTSLLNKALSGSLRIPDTLTGGMYKFVAFTNYLRNYTNEFQFEIPIIITRLNENKISLLRFAESKSSKQNIDIKPLLKLNSEKKTFKAGEECEIVLEIPTQKLNDSTIISISVNELSPFDSILKNQGINSSNSSQVEGFRNNPDNLLNSIDIDSTYYIKESGVYSITGQLLGNVSNSPLSNKLIVASYPDSTINFTYCYTNSEGKFRFFFNHRFDNKLITLQVLDNALSSLDVKWKLDNKALSPTTSQKTNEVMLSQGQELYLDKIKKVELVKRIYSEDTLTNDNVIQKSSGFAIEPDNIIYPADYEELNDFYEIAGNILPGVRFSKNSGEFKLSILDTRTQLMSEDDYLVFLNGQPFKNLNFIASLGSKDIERIEIYNAKYMYGSFNFNGIISIYSSNLNIEPSSYSNPYYLYNNAVNTTNDMELQRTNSKNGVPAIDTHVYWQSNLIISGNTNTEVRFSMPDIKSYYRVEIHGFNSKGQTIYNSEIFEVH